MALSPDGKILAVGGIFAPVGADFNEVLNAGINMGVIRLYDFVSGTMVGVLKGHTSPVNALAFSPDGRLLASLALDLSIRLWDLKQRRTLQVLGDNESVVTMQPRHDCSDRLFTGRTAVGFGINALPRGQAYHKQLVSYGSGLWARVPSWGKAASIKL